MTGVSSPSLLGRANHGKQLLIPGNVVSFVGTYTKRKIRSASKLEHIFCLFFLSSEPEKLSASTLARIQMERRRDEQTDGVTERRENELNTPGEKPSLDALSSLDISV